MGGDWGELKFAGKDFRGRAGHEDGILVFMPFQVEIAAERRLRTFRSNKTQIIGRGEKITAFKWRRRIFIAHATKPFHGGGRVK